MEKRSERAITRIVVTGPESTGKTNISDHLAKYFNALWIPEYARYYVSNLQNKYNYSDIVNIAQKQIDDYIKFSSGKSGLIIFDTFLIITKVWFDEVFHRYPSWLDQNIQELKIDLYLLCAPDIPWKSDTVRENGGIKREYLFNRYRDEIEKLNLPYFIISGSGSERYDSAVKLVEKFLKKHA